jgi:L-asparaginase II
MVTHPEFVAGTDRLDTDLMRIATSTPLFAKVGAEGFYCAGIPSLRLGVALKVEDGHKRASEPALLAVLHKLDALSNEQMHQLSRYAAPEIVNTRNESVGHLRTNLRF